MLFVDLLWLLKVAIYLFTQGESYLERSDFYDSYRQYNDIDEWVNMLILADV